MSTLNTAPKELTFRAMRRYRTSIAAALALIAPCGAFAYDFVPTALEFAAWPKYCQARYVETNVGRRSQFANQVTDSDRRMAEASIGAATYLHVHHHCAGIIWLTRARLESNPQARQHAIHSAISESEYTFNNTTPSSPLYGAVVTNIAWAEKLAGRIDVAQSYMEKAREANPSDPQPYISLALLYRDSKKLPLARQSLEDGLKATDNKAIEIHYNLGLICLELGDDECAVAHARTAYSAGYPFPGLKDKLRRQGLWNE